MPLPCWSSAKGEEGAGFEGEGGVEVDWYRFIYMKEEGKSMGGGGVTLAGWRRDQVMGDSRIGDWKATCAD